MEKIYISSSPEDTNQIATDLVKELVPGATICLIGDLASGKTTFTQAVGGQLGLPRVISPTYMIMKEYKVSAHEFVQNLFHLDLYRLTSKDDIKSFDLEEIWGKKENLVIIEWPEKILDILPSNHYLIYFKQTGPTQREIKITKNLSSSLRGAK